MREGVIVMEVRTPLGKRGVHPADLSARVVPALIVRAQINPESVDAVMWGCVSQIGEQTFDIARTAGPVGRLFRIGTRHNCLPPMRFLWASRALRHRGSGCQAIRHGHRRDGKSMTRVPMMSAMGSGLSPLETLYQQRYKENFPRQGAATERIARKWRLDRRAVDEYSLRSQERAAAATQAGLFAHEKIPPAGLGGATEATDEGIRSWGTLEGPNRLTAACPHDLVVTADDASQITDGAALIVTISELAPVRRPDASDCFNPRDARDVK